MTSTTRHLLQWEARWIPVEMAMVGFGLFLLLGLQLDEAGAFLLFVAMVVSGGVRWMHYAGDSRRQPPDQATGSGAEH